MADPISIASGIITFVGACQALVSTIQKLHRLRKAPQELEELETEISSLQSYTEGIKQLVDMHSCDEDQVIGRMPLGLHIKNAGNKIQKIQRFIENSLLDTSSIIKIRTRAWLRWQSEFKRLRQELRDVRMEIGSCIGLFSAAGHRQNEMQLERMFIEGCAMHDRNSQISTNFQQGMVDKNLLLTVGAEARLEIDTKSVEVSVRNDTSPLGETSPRRRRSEVQTRTDPETLSLDSDARRPRSQSSGNWHLDDKQAETNVRRQSFSKDNLYGERRPQSHLNRENSQMLPQISKAIVQHEPTASLELSHRQDNQCRRPCSCQCHRSSKLKTPDFLRQITGQLLVGYAGISSFTLPCNEHACSQRQKALVRIQYTFPVWSFIQQMLTVVSFAGGARGPEKILRMSRIRPGLDEVFIQVQSGNTNRLKQLFVKGDASPFDASDTGWTLLHYALSAGQYTTAKFLANAGADIHAESTVRKTPFDVSWNRILSGRLDTESELLLRGVFNEDEQLDERQFTTLHKVILGMIGRDLAEELEVSTAYIDAVDSSGYTPLAWASARGDHESVNLLLKYGASLGIANNVGEEAIHLAAQTGNINTIRNLVQAGTNVNEEVPLTHMTPMHYAAEYQDSYDQVMGLAGLGARVDARDYYCWTPLHWASWRGHFASLSALLMCDASVLCRTNDGNAPLMLAVANNSHQCVQRLIEAGANASVVRDSQWNILHYAAIGGSLDTLCALQAADVSGVDLHGLKTKDTGQAVIDMVTARLAALSMDENGAEKHESWKTAWDEVAKKTYSDRGVKDNYLNTFCHPSRSNTDSTYHDADDQPFEHRHEDSGRIVELLESD